MVLGKAIGGVALVGLVSVGGVAIAKPELLGMADPMPTWHSLAEDSDFSSKKDTASTDGYKDGIGKKYSRYFVGATHKSGDNNNDVNSKDWWEWSFRRLEKDNKPGNSKPGSKFASATSYGAGNNAINKICEAAYKANHDSSFVKNAEDSNAADKFKEADVWRYCSPLGNKPVSVKDTTATPKETTDTNHIGGEDGSKGDLISTIDTKNDLFWEIRDKEFKAGKSPFDISESDNKYFNAHKGKMKIKDICAAAYRQSKNNNTSADNTATKTETTKFCSFKEETNATQ